FPFVKLDLPFEFFISIVTLIPLYLFYYTINNYSQYKLGSLLIFSSMYYPIYINSAIRQGISLSIIFFALYKYLKKEKYFNYLFGNVSFVVSFIIYNLLDIHTNRMLIKFKIK